MATDVAAAGDEIDKNSQKIGISAKAYQEWAYVFERAGTDVEKLRAGMTKLSDVITDATNGSASAAAALSAVGLSIEQLNGLSQEEQLDLVIAALQGMETGAARTAAGIDLLSESATDLAAVLNMSAEEVDALKQEANEYGMVMSDDAVASSAAFADSLTRLNGTVDGLKRNLVGQLLPGITEVMDGIAALAAGSDNAAQTIAGGTQNIISSLGEMVPQAIGIVQSMATAILQAAPQIAGGLISCAR